MQNRIPGNKGPCVLRQLKSRKEQARSEYNQPLDYSFQKFCQKLIQTAKKNQANAKTNSHVDNQQVNANSQARAVHMKAPSESPNQSHQGQRNGGESPHIIEGQRQKNIDGLDSLVIKRRS